MEAKHRLIWGAALFVVVSCRPDGGPRGPLLEGNAAPSVVVTQTGPGAIDGGTPTDGALADGAFTDGAFADGAFADGAFVDSAFVGARFELLSATFSAPLSLDGPRQLRVAGQVLNHGPDTVTAVTIRDATLAWSGGGVDVPFSPDAPNPASVPPGSMRGPYFFIMTVQIPDFCADLPPSLMSTLEPGLVTMGFTASSNLFLQRFDGVDVGVECPPAPPLP
jgi:hypothetical protein